MKLVKESIEEFLNEGKYQQEVSNELPFTEQEFVDWVVDLYKEYGDDVDGAYLALKRLLRMNPKMHHELGDNEDMGQRYKKGMDILFKLFPIDDVSDETMMRIQGFDPETGDLKKNHLERDLDFSYQKKFA